MRLTRRGFLGGTAAAALGGGGIYELVDRLGSAPARPAVEPAGMPAEQHLLDLATTHSEGIEVVVPPLHSAVVTAKLHVPGHPPAPTTIPHAPVRSRRLMIRGFVSVT